jgi:hypothetical protein
MNNLGLLARPDLNALRQVQLNAVAVRPKEPLHDLYHLRQHDHRPYRLRFAREFVNASCALAIE